MGNAPAVVAMALLLFAALPASSAAAIAACAAPCGYINPQLYIDIPDSGGCSLTDVRAPDPDFSGCPAPPTMVEPLVMQGTFRLTWDISNEGIYLNDPNDPIEVSFRATSTNPSFIGFRLEPATFTLDSAQLYDPQYYVMKEDASGNSNLWYEYTAPITVTLLRVADPSPDDIERIHNRDGLVQVFIRIHSDPSGSTYRDSYGMEVFNFHVSAAGPDDPAVQRLDQGARGIPAAPMPLLMLLSVAAAVAIRHRR